MLSVQFSLVAQSCPTLCDPMNRSTPGLPVHHQLPEFTQTHVHQVGDAIQPPHPLSSPSPPAPSLSQHQGLFQWVSSSHEVAKVFWTHRTYIEHPGLIAFRMDWLDLLEVQGALIFYCNFKSKLKIFLVSSILWTKQLEPGNVFFFNWSIVAFLEKGMASHSSILAWRIPMDRGDCQATAHGVIRSETWLSN